ncbi:hypothetical protein G6F46_009505 [Rhizopus delemar]|uniref:Uncharacterized protein n=3 Tax=Rhizopus TaxID=4842 RepID=I1C618_RHIO9|nr:hypothetical protein RO3G_08603 [Rhizopus delemar RA 99-880]KAG1449612.1 hypothetical protein G6F55_010089 [Rhizopus delemar]KAG1540318.1 hypothetical protein G6F51_008598 [Rhizopus arrhizus]KAG1493654.1 hypothetical protein G6F54_008429 [Rhizopus delemar]KAG1506381.1 hypothetical protein G6F53_009731 [Rhizopus delemar]|eukprot:EIE83898.1 hypothetical protein RO3G_08603 [Rhizopus delemar RA 99-880]
MNQIDSNNSDKATLPSPPSSPNNNNNSISSNNNNHRKRALSLSFIQNSDTESVKKYRLSNLTPNQCDPKYNRSLLSWTCISQSTETLEGFIDDDQLDINQSSGPNHTTALHEAAFIGFYQGIQLLTRHPKIDLDATDNQGQTALHYAVQRNQVECLRVLLSAGARLDLSCQRGRLPIHTAALYGFESCICLLLSHDQTKNNPSQLDLLWTKESLNDQSAIECAVISGRARSLSHLLDHDRDSHYQNKKELVHLAVYWNRLECLQLLIQRQCLIDYASVLVAVQQRKIDIVRVLIGAGANPCLKNGQNPAFLYAANHGFLEMIPILFTLSTSKECIQQALLLSSFMGLSEKLVKMISQTVNAFLIEQRKKECKIKSAQ